MRVIINSNYQQCAQWAAEYVAYKIKAAHPTKEKPFVMALPAGSTPLGMFEALISMFKKGKISFQNVVFFNMNEYVGLAPEDKNSFNYYLWDNFFQHIDIRKKNIHLLNGQTKDFMQECASYEKLIRSYGGIDLLIAGIGEDGHIAFNEPGSSLGSRTRVKALNRNTIRANARFFNNNENLVPKLVVTMGVATIMDADEVMLIATGDKKADAIRCAIEGSVNHMCPVSILQMHPHALIVCDEEATSKLQSDIVRYFNDNENTKFGRKI
ncbi:MAG: glucosamine-6-phosphate deaminase [Alphaproteobacteria bacterium]|nr:glucosamine-6-phosphate deaminase [Alphaproteobacteria bacterium]